MVNFAHCAVSAPFTIYIQDEITTFSASQLHQDFTQVYQDISEKLGVQLQDSLDVVVRTPDPNQTFRGRTSGSTIEITTTNELPKVRVLGIFAHELSHILHRKWIGGLSVHFPLTEGFATWLAGDYWLDWHDLNTFSSAVLNYQHEGSYIPLNATFMELPTDDIQKRDIVYNEWAGFVGYLIEEFGLKKMGSYSKQMVTGPGNQIIDTEASFQEIYGMSQQELENRWLASLSQ